MLKILKYESGGILFARSSTLEISELKEEEDTKE